MTIAMLECIRPERRGIMSGVLNAGRQIGSVVGIALFGSLVARSGLVSGLHISAIVAAVAMALGCALSPLITHPDREEAATLAVDASALG